MANAFAMVLALAELDREDHAAKVAGGDAHALLRKRHAHRMEVPESGDERVGHGQRLLDLDDAGIGIVGRGLWRR